MKAFRKLNCRRGASIVIALVIFLLCALAGASALVMAAANAGRFSHSDEQEYYSVSSAAIYFVDLFTGSSGRLTYESQEILFLYERAWTYNTGTEGSGTTNQHNSTDSYTLTFSKDPGKMGGGSGTFTGSNFDLLTIIRDQCDQIVRYLNVPEEWYGRVKEDPDAPKRPAEPKTVTDVFTIEMTDYPQIGKITCTMTMGSNYDLLFTFKGENDEYAITLYWKAETEFKFTKYDPKYDYTTPTGGSYTEGHLTEKNSLLVTAKWRKENVTISRGDATKAVKEEGTNA